MLILWKTMAMHNLQLEFVCRSVIYSVKTYDFLIIAVFGLLNCYLKWQYVRADQTYGLQRDRHFRVSVSFIAKKMIAFKSKRIIFLDASRMTVHVLVHI